MSNGTGDDQPRPNTSRWPLANGSTGVWVRKTPPYLLVAALGWVGNTMMEMRNEITLLKFEVQKIELRLDSAGIGTGPTMSMVHPHPTKREGE